MFPWRVWHKLWKHSQISFTIYVQTASSLGSLSEISKQCILTVLLWVQLLYKYNYTLSFITGNRHQHLPQKTKYMKESLRQEMAVHVYPPQTSLFQNYKNLLKSRHFRKVNFFVIAQAILNHFSVLAFSW